MKKLDLSKYKITKGKLPAHRFQQLVLDAFKKFDIDAKGKGMVWGRIGFWKRKEWTNDQIEFQISKFVTATEELTPKNPARYFVKLFFTL